MTAAAVLAILVAAGEASAPASQAMLGAASEVVGELGRVELVEGARISDAEALGVERERGVRAIVALEWTDTNRLHAHLRLHAARTDRWIDRELVFAPADTAAERGRTLGFAAASMLPEGDPSLPLAAAEPSAAPAAPVSVPVPAFARNAVEATFVAATSAAGGLGARVSYERFLANAASIDVALASRLGRIDQPEARVVTSTVALGAALWPVAPSADRRLGLGARAELMLIHEAVAHESTWRSELLPGAGLSLAGTCRLGGAFEAVVAGGVEAAFGTTDVTVIAGAPEGGTARLPAWRAVGQVGVRARF